MHNVDFQKGRWDRIKKIGWHLCWKEIHDGTTTEKLAVLQEIAVLAQNLSAIRVRRNTGIVKLQQEEFPQNSSPHETNLADSKTPNLNYC